MSHEEYRKDLDSTKKYDLVKIANTGDVITLGLAIHKDYAHEMLEFYNIMSKDPDDPSVYYIVERPD